MPDTEKIKQLNDAFRATFSGGRVVMTQGIQALGEDQVHLVMTKVREFNDFTEENDPHGEHDFGSIEMNDQKVFWKIDYYNADCKYGSEDPADPTQTTRVLTVMLASEY